MHALHREAIRRHVPLLRIISLGGIDINLRTETGFKALVYTAGGESVDTITFLLENDADFYIRDKASKTLFAEAMEFLVSSPTYTLGMPDAYELANGHELTRGRKLTAERGGIVRILVGYGADVH